MDDNEVLVAVGEQVGRYIVESEFSRHNYSRLYVARHAILDRKVLLKFISHDSPMGIERIQYEARILARLQHPSIIAIHDIDVHQGQPYLVLSYVEGGRTLADIMQNGNPLLPTVVLRLMSTICSAVRHAHDQGLIHKDIKPTNIIIGYDGTPVLMGFGIAASASGDPLFAQGIVVGTPPYMSPEQWRGQQLTPASDIWSIGITLYELLVGHGPFDTYKEPMEAGYAITAPQPVSLDALAGTFPQNILSILERCLQKEPAVRFPSVEEVGHALSAALIELEQRVEHTARVSVPVAGEGLLLYSEHVLTDRLGHYRHYQLHSMLGSGSFADVYQAVDTLSGAEVALKILKKQWIADEQAVARFRREASLLARLAHPNIVTIFDYGQYGESFYIVLELVIGQTLAEYLREQPICTPNEAATVLIPVLRGLDAAHRLGIIHRDLKPTNIIIAKEKVVILDFGIAYSVYATHITAPGMLIGTAAYMSPEQTRAEPLTPASDMYTVGTVLYEMLTGCYPHESDNLYSLLNKIATEAPVPITERRNDLPPLIVQLLAMLHHPDPSARLTASDTADLLLVLVEDVPG